jgi:hypothetical protein
VTLTSLYYHTTACVDFFNLYRIDAGLEDMLVTTLVRARPGSWVFKGTFLVVSNFPGETFSYRAIPVIEGRQEPGSELVTTALEALSSNGSTTPPATAPATAVPITSPTRAPVTAGTPTPTRAPVTPAPTEPTTLTPTIAPATAIPTTRSPTGVPTDPQTGTPTRVPTDAPPVFEQLLVLQGAPEAEFGNTIQLSSDGTILAVGAPFNSEFGSEAGRVGLYEIEGNTATTLFDFSGAQVGLRVGQSLSISRNIPPILAIGGTDFVDVYPISQFLGGGGGPDPPVLEFDRFEADFIDEQYGTAIAVSGDGTLLAVGAPGAFINNPNVGMVQVYLVGGTGQVGNEILGTDGNDLFGSAVSLSETGAIIAVGALTGASGAGYVNLYSAPDPVTTLVWNQIGQSIIGRAVGDNLGQAVSISADGLTVAIGAFQADAGAAEVRPGYVQVFQNVANTWTQIGEDIVGVNDGDRFGFSVALTADATFLTIGANGFDNDGFVNNGLARIFENVNGTWTQIGGDIVGNASTRNLGTSVAISSNGETIAVGGPLSTAPVDTNIGEASVFFLR